MNLTEFILKNSYSDQDIKTILDSISPEIEDIDYTDILKRHHRSRKRTSLSRMSSYSSVDESEEDIKQLYDEAQEIETDRDDLVNKIEEIEKIQDSLINVISELCSLLEENKGKIDRILEIVNE
jgi:predicted nuclease with TOPRIM domain